jgi:hypothetical protein
VGGKWLYDGVPLGTVEPKVAAVAGVRELGSGGGPCTNRLGESPSPELGPGAEKPAAGDGTRPERGEGAAGE